jgi:hypothetical protein
MCAVSVIHDYMSQRVPVERWTPAEYQLLQDILTQVKKLDEALGEKDCEDSSKAQYLQDIRARLGEN